MQILSLQSYSAFIKSAIPPNLLSLQAKQPLAGLKESLARSTEKYRQIEDCRVHDIRHTFCTLAARQGASNLELATAMGTYLGMLQRYTHLDVEITKKFSKQISEQILQGVSHDKKLSLQKQKVTRATISAGVVLDDLREMIKKTREFVASTVNSSLTLLYWHVVIRIRREILQEERAEYGRSIVASLSEQLVLDYGNGFNSKNCIGDLFSEIFPDEKLLFH